MRPEAAALCWKQRRCEAWLEALCAGRVGTKPTIPADGWRPRSSNPMKEGLLTCPGGLMAMGCSNQGLQLCAFAFQLGLRLVLAQWASASISPPAQGLGGTQQHIFCGPTHRPLTGCGFKPGPSCSPGLWHPLLASSGQALTAPHCRLPCPGCSYTTCANLSTAGTPRATPVIIVGWPVHYRRSVAGLYGPRPARGSW